MAHPTHYITSLSEQAFFTVVTAALEAYRVSHPKNAGMPHQPVETCGNLWGYAAKTKRNELIHHVTLADVDASADQQPGSVTPSEESFNIKADFVDRFRPEVEYLGDFHSHPYDHPNDGVRSALGVERADLFSFSDDDVRAAIHLHKKRNYRVGLVVTVLETSVRRENKHVGKNSYSCIRFSYDNFTIWLKAHLVIKGEMVPDADVSLICPAIGFHAGTVEQDN